MSNYVTPKTARQRLGVSNNALKDWENNGTIKTIRTPGGKRLYDITSLEKQKTIQISTKNTVCYCRVSTAGQQNDLSRQINEMRERFPDATIVTDIASGINFKRKGLRSILEQASKGLISEVVVAYRDRLCRFSFELIEWFLQLHSVKLVVLNQSMGGVQPNSNTELIEDILAIINVFNCRINGQRRYTNGSKKNQQDEKIKQTNCQHLSKDQIVSEPEHKEKVKIVVRVRQKNLQSCVERDQREPYQN